MSKFGRPRTTSASSLPPKDARSPASFGSRSGVKRYRQASPRSSVSYSAPPNHATASCEKRPASRIGCGRDGAVGVAASISKQ